MTWNVALEPSILERRAQARKISEYLDAEPDAQTELYCETLIEMSFFLGTGILINLAKKSMVVLLNDVIKIISGLLLMQSVASRPKNISSIDGALEYLMQAKDHFQIAYKMYRNDLIPENKSKKFLAELGQARESIGKSLERFDQNLVKELKNAISIELLKQKKESNDGLSTIPHTS